MEQTTKYTFNKYAIQYQEKYMDIDLYTESLDVFCAAVKTPEAQILEIGCGPGNITQHLLNKQENYKIFGIDLAPNMIELAKANNPSASFKTMDCKDIDQINATYDAIVCGFCLPYLNKPQVKKFIQDASSLLKSNGILYISTMEDDYKKSGLSGPSSGGIDTTYIYYHQSDYLQSYLKDCHLNIINMQHIDAPQIDKTTYKDLIIIAQKINEG